jgi:hypothetical protein
MAANNCHSRDMKVTFVRDVSKTSQLPGPAGVAENNS